MEYLMPKKSSRNTRLRVWLLERDIALRTVAEALGVSRQRLSYIVNAPTITPQMHKRICDIGIPGDHGDRLHGKYRGHDPKLMDNPALRWVPFMLYLSPSAQKQEQLAAMLDNAAKLKDLPISHDMLFHSLLGFSGIKAPAYEPKLDLFSGQAIPHNDPFTQILGIEQTGPM